MRNAAEGQDHFEPGEAAQNRSEMRATARDLVRRRPVPGGKAVDCIGDHAANEPEAIVGSGAVAALRQAERKQRAEEELAGEIPGEGPPGAVGAPLAGGKADDGKPGLRVAEARHRPVEPARRACAQRGAVRNEPGAERAVAGRIAGKARRLGQGIRHAPR